MRRLRLCNEREGSVQVRQAPVDGAGIRNGIAGGEVGARQRRDVELDAVRGLEVKECCAISVSIVHHSRVGANIHCAVQVKLPYALSRFQQLASRNAAWM